MIYSLEHLIFLVLQFPYLHHDILENMRSFQIMFNDTKNPKVNTVNFLLDLQAPNAGIWGTGNPHFPVPLYLSHIVVHATWRPLTSNY